MRSWIAPAGVFGAVLIACYDFERGDYFRAHRDNTTPATAGRRFALLSFLLDPADLKAADR